MSESRNKLRALAMAEKGQVGARASYPYLFDPEHYFGTASAGAGTLSPPRAKRTFDDVVRSVVFGGSFYPRRRR